MNQETILTRDRVECLVRNLIQAIKPDSVYQVKIRIEAGTIKIIPHCEQIEVTIDTSDGSG